MTRAKVLRAASGLVLAWGLALATWAVAQDVRIAPSGQSALDGTLTRALDAWNAGFDGPVGIELADSPDDASADVRVRQGDRGLLGPDVASLTLLEPGAPTTVWIAPAYASALYPLLHELGLVLGVPTLAPGTAPRVARAEFAASADARPSAPSLADIAALRATRAFAPEDLNRDGVVDFYDLMALSQAFGTRGFLPADLDGNGVVDAADLELLRRAYTFAPPAAQAPAGDPVAPAAGAEGSADGGSNEDEGP